jgi:hypothetical protein
MLLQLRAVHMPCETAQVNQLLPVGYTQPALLPFVGQGVAGAILAGEQRVPSTDNLHTTCCT